MTLYLCVYDSDTDDDSEIDGVDVGSYADWDGFRRTVAVLLESGQVGSRFPVLNTSDDADTDWSPAECRLLRRELATIRVELAQHPCGGYQVGSWQQQVATDFNLKPANRAEWFLDLDGESLISRLDALAALAIKRDRPLSFM